MRKRGEDEGLSPEQVADAQAPATKPAVRANPVAKPSGPTLDWRLGAYAVGILVTVVGFYYAAGSMSRERGENDSMTGGDIIASQTGSTAKEISDPQLRAAVQAAKLRAEQHPDDVAAWNDLSDQMLRVMDWQGMLEANDKALKIAPKDPTARSYRAVLSMKMGMPDQALAYVDDVVAEHPDHPLAVPYRGLFLLEMGRFDEAVEMLEKALAILPGNPSIQSALQTAKALANGETPPPQGMPKDGQLIVAGTMALAPDAQGTITGNEVVFVSVKDPNKPGPPLAADRLAARFPGAFRLTTADIRAMAGAPVDLPPRVNLTIRVDRDGNAMTKEDAPRADLVDVALGSDNLNVVLANNGGGAAAPSAAPAASGEAIVSGTITLGPGASSNPRQTLFISVKDPAGGPPLAADRRVGATFPYTFKITTANIVAMGGARPIPDQIAVSARLDNDGNAFSKDGEPAATITTTKGASTVELTLQ